jgi:hypothetical protein
MHGDPPAPVEQVRVVEVDVHEPLVEAAGTC